MIRPDACSSRWESPPERFWDLPATVTAGGRAIWPTEFLTPDTAGIGGWLPGDGGTIYNSDMDVFFQTFYANPTADWKYILGFESGLMRPEDLEVLRRIQWNRGAAFAAYEPWVKKMRPSDRMILRAPGGAGPGIPELEWHYAATGLWIGRLPQTQPAANGPPK